MKWMCGFIFAASATMLSMPGCEHPTTNTMPSAVLMANDNSFNSFVPGASDTSAINVMPGTSSVVLSVSPRKRRKGTKSVRNPDREIPVSVSATFFSSDLDVHAAKRRGRATHPTNESGGEMTRATKSQLPSNHLDVELWATKEQVARCTQTPF